MSDLLLPFVLLMEDDGLAFWCFVALMQQQGVRKNFAVDETGIFSQLRTLRQVRVIGIIQDPWEFLLPMPAGMYLEGNCKSYKQYW